jgi:hypothetical protein
MGLSLITQGARLVAQLQGIHWQKKSWEVVPVLYTGFQLKFNVFSLGFKA